MLAELTELTELMTWLADWLAAGYGSQSVLPGKDLCSAPPPAPTPETLCQPPACLSRQWLDQLFSATLSSTSTRTLTTLGSFIMAISFMPPLI